MGICQKWKHSNHPEIIVLFANFIQNVAAYFADLRVVAVCFARYLQFQMVPLDEQAERVDAHFLVLVAHILFPQLHQFLHQVQHYQVQILLLQVQVAAALLQKVLFQCQLVGDRLAAVHDKMGQDVVQFHPQLRFLLVPVHDHESLHDVLLAQELVGGCTFEHIVGKQPAAIPPHFPALVAEEGVNFVKDLVFGEIACVILGLGQDIPQYSDGVSLNFRIRIGQILHDLGHQLL